MAQSHGPLTTLKPVRCRSLKTTSSRWRRLPNLPCISCLLCTGLRPSSCAMASWRASGSDPLWRHSCPRRYPCEVFLEAQDSGALFALWYPRPLLLQGASLYGCGNVVRDQMELRWSPSRSTIDRSTDPTSLSGHSTISGKERFRSRVAGLLSCRGTIVTSSSYSHFTVSHSDWESSWPCESC